MTNIQTILLNILSSAMFGAEIDDAALSEGTVQSELAEEARNQAVVLLAFDSVKGLITDPDTLNRWNSLSMAVLTNNIRVIHNHELLHKWMSEAGIPYVVLKGCASASYYPKPSLRTMGDVDFLVPNEYLEMAGEVLKSHGLEPWEENHIAHIVYRKQGMHLEMHFNVAGIPSGEAGDLTREYLRDIFDKGVVKPIGNTEAVMPSDFHHGLIILLHTCHHLTGEGVGLRHLCDWAAFENSLTDEEFRELFEEKLRAIGLWRFAQVLTSASIKYLGAAPRSWAEDCDADLVDALMEDILDGGNFGRKDSNRANQRYIISSHGKNGVGRTGMLHQAFTSMNEIIYVKWPFFRKCKLLLPFGWIYFGARHIFRVITGKRRRINVSGMVRGAGERRELYSRLGLYEDGDE